MHTLRNTLAETLKNALFPENNACHLCGRFVSRAGMLCSLCADELNAARYPVQSIASAEMHAPLKACLSAYPHNGLAREMVHLLKYQSDCAAAQPLAEAMAAALVLCPQTPNRLDAVIPVPLHPSRLEMRGYNQALLLAQGVCRHTGLGLLQDALIRVQPTDTQLHRDRAQRLHAMRHAFAVNDPQALRGLHVLLVDDVLTTGATAISCANALLDAGAAQVWLLTACRA